MKYVTIIKIKFFLFKYGLYAFIFAMIGIFAYFNNKIIEAIFLFICYISLRYCYPKTWHSNNFYVCIFFSILSFWLAIPLTFSINISLLSCVVVGSIIGFILYKVKDYDDTKIENSRLLINEVKARKINIYILSEKQLYNYCKSHGLSDEDSRIAYFIVIERLKGKEFYSAIGYSEAQSKRKRKQIMQILNNKK